MAAWQPRTRTSWATNCFCRRSFSHSFHKNSSDCLCSLPFKLQESQRQNPSSVESRTEQRAQFSLSCSWRAPLAHWLGPLHCLLQGGGARTRLSSARCRILHRDPTLFPVSLSNPLGTHAFTIFIEPWIFFLPCNLSETPTESESLFSREFFFFGCKICTKR